MLLAGPIRLSMSSCCALMARRLWRNGPTADSGKVMQLVDTGAQLTHESFRHDVDAVLDRAKHHGVVQHLVSGASGDGSTQALAPAQAQLWHALCDVRRAPAHAINDDHATDALLREMAMQAERRAVGDPVQRSAG